MENDNNLKGELNGFDIVDNGDATSENNGTYQKSKQDIIQDEIINTSGQPTPDYNEEAQYTPPVNNPYNGYEKYAAPKPKKEKKRYGVGVVIVSAVLAAIIGAVSCLAVTVPLLVDSDGSTAQQGGSLLNKVNINVDKTAQNVVEAVAQKATPSVVGIRTTTSVMNFFGGTQESSGEGSGVIYTSDGYIITNYHVISGALSGNNSKISVYLDSAESDGYNATVVGYNISADLAVIKIDVKNLTAVEFADSDSLSVGQYVITIGSPGGLEFMDSVTYGVISGLNRVVSSDSDVKLIQTDAAINPGNSGGALLNINGELVGINSSKIVSEEFEGMGFAIPSNTVKEICDGIIERENAPEAYIGISISTRYTSEVLDYYGFPNGAVVLSVADGSPADKAGIAKGDIITEYNGKSISEYQILENEITNSTPGETVSIKFYRSGKYYSIEVTVGSNNALN